MPFKSGIPRWFPHFYLILTMMQKSVDCTGWVWKVQIKVATKFRFPCNARDSETHNTASSVIYKRCKKSEKFQKYLTSSLTNVNCIFLFTKKLNEVSVHLHLNSSQHKTNSQKVKTSFLAASCSQNISFSSFWRGSKRSWT